MKGGFTLYNGKFHKENDLLFSGLDLFRLTSGIKESFRTENNLILFAEDNFDYLLRGLTSIHLPVPKDWNLSRFKSDVSRLLNKNHFYLAAKVTIHLIPSTSGTEYLMSAEELSNGFYPIVESNLLIDFYTEGSKSVSKQSAFELSSRALWTSATHAAMAQGKNNLILLNQQESACESIGGSFGYISNKTVYFPSVRANGYIPPILSSIKRCVQKCGYMSREIESISKEDLMNADELFLIDNCLGILSVLGLNSRRYYKSETMALAHKLQEIARVEHPST
jgi:branched-subunit amino acid aminotransferase/4-amino-4-deoxychorismate lyase